MKQPESVWKSSDSKASHAPDYLLIYPQQERFVLLREMAPARYAPLAGWYKEKGNGQFIFTYPHWKDWETQNYTLLGENLMWSTSNKVFRFLKINLKEIPEELIPLIDLGHTCLNTSQKPRQNESKNSHLDSV
jgi:hypothetical protein